jgi:hypothetical protein
MSPSIDPFYWRVARIALSVAGDHGFALGGGLALVAQGVLDRPTQDVDLFSDREGSVRGAAEAVCRALELNGIEAVVEEGDSYLDEVIEGLDEYMVELTAYRDPADREGVRLSLGQLYRSRSPVILDVGAGAAPGRLAGVEGSGACRPCGAARLRGCRGVPP